MPKVALVNIGCKVNQAELDELALDLSRAGVEIARFPEEADICILNTCTVTGESDRKCRKAVNSLLSRGARLVVAGCFAQRFREELKDRPGVLAVLDNPEKRDWFYRIMEILERHPCRERKMIGKSEGLSRFRTRGFLKIQEGCSRFCSYCIVPMVRGRERSVDPEEVLRRARALIERGVGELVICGTNLGRYSWKGMDLAGLVSRLCSLEGDFRVRLSSIEPEDLKEEWVLEWERSGRVCPHLHLPLQSGSQRILSDMGRGYGPRDYLELWQRISRAWPGCVLTTEVIVGYPGETEEDFLDTVELVRMLRPVKLHVFRYSPRPGTMAAGRSDQVDAATKARRSRRLIDLGDRMRREYMLKRLGGVCRMVVEEIRAQGATLVARGTTEDYLKGRIILDMDGDAALKEGKTVEGTITDIVGEEVLISPVSCQARQGGQFGELEGKPG